MSRVTVFLLAVFLLAVLMASSAHAEISHYYQQPNGWTTDPILDIYGNKHSWAGIGDIWHNAVYNHSLYSGVELCPDPTGHFNDINDADRRDVILSGATLDDYNFSNSWMNNAAPKSGPRLFLNRPARYSLNRGYPQRQG
jgi:hypothetical protein